MFARLAAMYRDKRAEWRLAIGFVVLFLAIYFVPAGTTRFDNAILEGIRLTNWYAREHVILCLLPAFVIAGAMAVYINQGAVLRYLGPDASKPVALGVASLSGSLLAVCSCTVLPLFGGIYRRGAGLGAATAFLYSGPAINVMAVVVTAKVLGYELGVARAVGAIVFAFVIGAIMHWLYRDEERARAKAPAAGFQGDDGEHGAGSVGLFFALMVGVLVFANWAPADNATWMRIYDIKWAITALLAIGFAVLLVWRWQWSVTSMLLLGLLVATAAFALPAHPEVPFVIAILGLMAIASMREADREWVQETWSFTKQIMPLLLVGVFVAGLLLGRPGHEGLIPSAWVAAVVGDNSLASNLIASVLGALMYFSTLTEVPIVDGLLGAGMGKGPALSLLLAGPALSLPNMLVIRSVLGTRKTLTYCLLVVVMATATGYLFGNYW